MSTRYEKTGSNEHSFAEQLRHCGGPICKLPRRDRQPRSNIAKPGLTRTHRTRNVDRRHKDEGNLPMRSVDNPASTSSSQTLRLPLSLLPSPVLLRLRPLRTLPRKLSRSSEHPETLGAADGLGKHHFKLLLREVWYKDGSCEQSWIYSSQGGHYRRCGQIRLEYRNTFIHQE
jgi:hypothetical protein